MLLEVYVKHLIISKWLRLSHRKHFFLDCCCWER